MRRTDTAATDIVVRKPRWDFPQDLGDVFQGPDVAEDCFRAAVSLTLPYLEPYLIRTCRTALDQITDEHLRADVAAFVAQEAQHHRNHAQANRVMREHLGPHTAAALLAIEEELDAEYHRFSAERSLRFNTAYAEGFEAMTCALAITRLSEAAPEADPGSWQQLWAWHLAEEIEHRTVAYDVYHHLGGTYLRRVATGLHAQLHYLRYIDRLHRVLAAHHGLRRGRSPFVPEALRAGWRRYVNTFHPRYDPRDVVVPAIVPRLLAAFDAADRPGSP